jgi:quercetin dioxygenase-like cupin family protein
METGERSRDDAAARAGPSVGDARGNRERLLPHRPEACAVFRIAHGANAKGASAMKIIDYKDVLPRELTAATMHGVTGRVLIGKADGADHFCMRMIEVAPGGVIPRHKHPWEHQQFFHSGQGRLLRDGDWVDVGPGSVAYIPPDAEHSIENTGGEPLLLVCLVPDFAPEL